jgi:hypothetical protein
MSYTAIGSIRLKGCASFEIQLLVPVVFGVGSIVYSKAQAQKGKLEKLAIKRINLIDDNSNDSFYVINYVDSMNRVWLEDELVWQADALSLAIAYWENIQEQISNSTCGH